MTIDLPDSKPCPKCTKLEMPFQQGMVMEEDHHYPNGNPRFPPLRNYRCQDCDYHSVAFDPRERSQEQRELGVAWYARRMHQLAEVAIHG